MTGSESPPVSAREPGGAIIERATAILALVRASCVVAPCGPHCDCLRKVVEAISPPTSLVLETTEAECAEWAEAYSTTPYRFGAKLLRDHITLGGEVSRLTAGWNGAFKRAIELQAEVSRLDAELNALSHGVIKSRARDVAEIEREETKTEVAKAREEERNILYLIIDEEFGRPDLVPAIRAARARSQPQSMAPASKEGQS